MIVIVDRYHQEDSGSGDRAISPVKQRLFLDDLLRKYQGKLSGKSCLKTPLISTYQRKSA
jgi:hypothetical protein